MTSTRLCSAAALARAAFNSASASRGSEYRFTLGAAGGGSTRCASSVSFAPRGDDLPTIGLMRPILSNAAVQMRIPGRGDRNAQQQFRVALHLDDFQQARVERRHAGFFQTRPERPLVFQRDAVFPDLRYGFRAVELLDRSLVPTHHRRFPLLERRERLLSR